MKKYISSKLWILVLVGLLASCSEDFLDVPLLVVPSAESFDPETAVTISYNININSTAGQFPNLRWRNWQTFLQADAISDDAFKSGDSDDDQPALRWLELFSATSDNAQARQFYESQYIKIYHMNWTINGIRQNRTVSEELRQRYIAEVMFLRALNYFWLNRTFGGVVPILDIGIEELIPRATEAEIYRIIEQDLLHCINVLPEKYPESELGRATRGAARGLLAKVYLYQGKYTEAFDQTSAVINSGQYRLEDDFANLWKRGLPNDSRNEHGPESVFEFTFAPSDLRTNRAVWAQAQRPREQLGDGKGWGMITPTFDLLDLFETGDPRIVSTFLFHGDSMLDPTGNSKIMIDAITHGVNEHRMYNHKVVRSPIDNSDHTDNFAENFIVLRYADILLMHAEAANEIGNTSQAHEKLNMVRARARNSVRTDYRREFINFNGTVPGFERQYLDYEWNALDQASILPDVTISDKVALRHAIWRERRVEFAFEGERFWDLARQNRIEPNRVGNVMRAFAQKYNTDKGRYFIDGIHERFPIPQSEIDLLGPVLMPQNPGY